MFEKIRSFFREKKVNEASLVELEELLYDADIGSATIQTMMAELKKKGGVDFLDIKQIFIDTWLSKLAKLEKNIEIKESPFVIFFIGVNGVGKTTTLAKVANRFKPDKKILMVAADTFRAAAQEQLEQWGHKIQVPVILPVIFEGKKKDPSSVIFDALENAQKNKYDMVLIDTAGRLHTKEPLIEELKKMKRIAQKVISTAPHEIWMVVDANTGQNIISQCRLFHEAIGITGLIITKMDGTAKGGGLLTLVEELSLPIAYLGTGEHIEDLKSFNARDYLVRFLEE